MKLLKIRLSRNNSAYDKITHLQIADKMSLINTIRMHISLVSLHSQISHPTTQLGHYTVAYTTLSLSQHSQLYVTTQLYIDFHLYTRTLIIVPKLSNTTVPSSLTHQRTP